MSGTDRPALIPQLKIESNHLPPRRPMTLCHIRWESDHGPVTVSQAMAVLTAAGFMDVPNRAHVSISGPSIYIDWEETH